MDLKEKDRIGQYLMPHLNEIIFDELSDAYLEKAGIKDIMTDVPVPMRKHELSKITVLSIARAMAFVIGCDPSFKYKDNYVQYILRNFDKRFAEGLVAEGVEGADKKDYDYACIQFRAAMQIDPDNAKAYYCYGRACKDAYELGEDEDFIGRFKAEALEAFEVATIKDDKFADAYYYLGYAYLNLGLYVKTKLTWEEYLKLLHEQNNELMEAVQKASDEEEKKQLGEMLKERIEVDKEISERLSQLTEPVKIEEGYNLIVSGKFRQGLDILEKYKDGQYAKWWPLWYYMGTAYSMMDEPEKAIENYLEVLKLSPSNQDVMTELVTLYSKLGDSEKAEKYSRKLEVVKANQAADKALREEADQRGEHIVPNEKLN